MNLFETIAVIQMNGAAEAGLGIAGLECTMNSVPSLFYDDVI